MTDTPNQKHFSFGPQLIGTVGHPHTRFRFWAPSLERVTVEIDGMPPLPMHRLKDGWFEAEAECGVGARYRFRIRDDLAVPDPASRAQAGDVHDASIVCDPDAYRWKSTEWKGRPWHEAVIYELHPGAFGGFNGIAQRLPALAELGITAVELMPIADFPGPRNWGYDGVLPYAPDAAYGTPDELKAMIDAAHGLGLMIFLDVVYNHFGPDGNYLSLYAEPFFRDDIDTPWGKAIDFRRLEVSDFFIENAIYWINEFRFDGLRFDAVHAISDKEWLAEMAERVRTRVSAQRHVHLVLENDENLAWLLERSPRHLFNAQWNDDMHHALHVLLTGEREGYYADYADDAAAKAARGLAEGFVYQGESSPYADGRPRGEPSAYLPPTAFVDFLQNHDQIGNRAFGERLTRLADPHALRAAMALLLLSPHIPMLFMGEEFGATQPFLYFTSHTDPKLADAVRDGRRQEFARFAAFADPARRARIPDPNAERTFLDSIPKPEEDNVPHWLHWVTRLLEVRRREIVPRLEGARGMGAKAIGPAAVSARWCMGDGAILSIAFNLAPQYIAIDADTLPAGGTLLFETEGAEGAAVSTGDNGLPGHAFVATLLEVAT